MIRQATIRDIPVLAKHWYTEKAKTCFSDWKLDWTVEGCAAHLAGAMADDNQYIVVDEQGGKILASCGAILYPDYLPPHPLLVSEWMWWGDDRKACARVLYHTSEWGKGKGAVAMRYILNSQRRIGKGKFSETYQWRVF